MCILILFKYFILHDIKWQIETLFIITFIDYKINLVRDIYKITKGILNYTV